MIKVTCVRNVERVPFSRFFLFTVKISLAMDASIEDLKNAFDELGVIANRTILERCLELCKKYNISDAEDLADAWMAYSVSKLNGEHPTLVYLNKFERDEYMRKNKESYQANKDVGRSSLVVYEANNMELDLDSTSEIMKVYDENSSKGRSGVELQTPDKRSRNKSSPQVTFSPASFSPTITSLSSKYTTRTNSGEVVFPYKNEDFKSNRTSSTTLKMQRLNTVDIRRYMNFELVDALNFAEDVIDKIGSEILKKFNLEDPMPIRYKHPSPFITVGRIACDSDGRLNSKSVILEGSRDASMGESIPLDLGGIEDKYSVFPGQVVAVEGVNITGDRLMVKKLFSDASLESYPPDRPLEPLRMVAAAGPFTQSDSMTYQPLLDLVEHVASNEPDILVLTGPFIDSNHPVIIENSLAETHQELFGKIVDQIMRPLQGKKTQVVMVSSYKDCNANCVYPTTEFTLNDKHYQNLHLLPDPSIVDVGGVVIGVTSTDSLMHIGKEEISSPGYSTDRLSRLAGHIISQRNFYPLTPSAGVPVDPSFMEFAKMKVKPHILILPSDLRYFIKNVSGCVVVNPERLAKGVIGGTYARLNLTPTGLDGEIVRI